MSAYPRAAAVLMREAESLTHAPRITLETPVEQEIGARNRSLVAAELRAAAEALLYADERLAVLRELVAAAKRNDGGGMDDATVWLRRAVKQAEGLL